MVDLIRAPWVPSIVGVALPIALIFGVGVLKKLVRGPGGYEALDFYQGIELCWAVLGAAVLYFYDLALAFSGGVMSGTELVPRLLLNTILVITTLGVTITVAAQHQELESSANVARQVVVLGIICNAVGVALFFCFVVIVRGE